jgi:hypothetical protein
MARASEFSEAATAESRHGKIILRSTGKRVILSPDDALYLAQLLVIAIEESDPEFFKEVVSDFDNRKLHRVLGMG